MTINGSSKLKYLLSFYTITIILLSVLLGILLKLSTLAIVSSIIPISYLLSFIAWRYYQQHKSQQLQLANYCQFLAQGETNIAYHPSNHSGELSFLEQQITELAEQLSQQKTQQSQTEQQLIHILAHWPFPVCLFDQQLSLYYQNNAMKQVLAEPLLEHTHFDTLGFSYQQGEFSHPAFDHHWHCQQLAFDYSSQQFTLFIAVNIQAPMTDHQQLVEQNLIRVLSHEVNNALTPISSLTDTLLQTEQWQPAQVKTILQRINQRSQQLLTFIKHYAQLQQVPKANCQWHTLAQLVKPLTSLLTPEPEISLHGQQQVFADAELLSQLLLNVFKNSVEANHASAVTEISIKVFFNGSQQIIEIADNGPGIANLPHAILPLYSTKANGSGVGLYLANQIAKQHNGNLVLANSDNGLKITLSWPFS